MSTVSTLETQYPHTNSANRRPNISLRNKLRVVDKKSRHFLFGDNFINSYNFLS